MVIRFSALQSTHRWRPHPCCFGTKRIGDPAGDVERLIFPVRSISFSQFLRVSSSASDSGYMGPHAVVFSSCRSILQSYGLWSGSTSTASLHIIPRYCWNFIGTSPSALPLFPGVAAYPMILAEGSFATESSHISENFSVSYFIYFSFIGTSPSALPLFPAVATYPMILAEESFATESSHVSENFSVSYFVYFSRQVVLLNRISAEVQMPCGGCLVIQLNGRNMSISGSMGDISNPPIL